MFVNAVDQRVAYAHDRVTNHIFGSGLTLASIVSSQRVDDDIAQRLLGVIDELDRAVSEIRSAALVGAIQERDAYAEVPLAPAARSPIPDLATQVLAAMMDGVSARTRSEATCAR